MKIIAKNPSVKSMRLIVPIDGLIDIDANGMAEVSDKAAEMLVNNTNDWAYETPEDANDEIPGENNEAENEEQEEVNDTPEEEDKKPEDDEIIAGIKAMKLNEMISMAKEAKYPESEWKRFKEKEKLMAAYLIKKYNEVKD